MKPFPKPIKVLIAYDETLQNITKVKHEEALVSEGMNFVMFLKYIFDSYPEIYKLYPPGSVGLTLNGKPPREFDILNNRDKVSLSIGHAVN